MQQIQSTTEIWTSGIVNVPLDPLLGDSRYTFFEIDTKDKVKRSLVFETYLQYLDSVYIHETMNGYHFYNLTPIDKKSYGLIIRKLKHLNPLCPMTTLRILPNKWQNELEVWKNGIILSKLSDITFDELKRFKVWLENGHTHMISNNYQVVRYPLEECPTCKKSKHVVCGYDMNRNNFFYCSLCGTETRGRLNK